MFLLPTCIADSWPWPLDGPTVIGWLTTVAYLVTAFLAYCVARSVRSDEVELRLFWTAIAVGFTFLAINQQLYFQTLFTAVLRCMSQASGWYEERRHNQALFIIALASSAVFLLAGALLYLRRVVPLIGIAVLGCAMVATFVLMRAATFHHEEDLIGIPLLGKTEADIFLEFPGIFLVACNAAWFLLKRDHKSPGLDN